MYQGSYNSYLSLIGEMCQGMRQKHSLTTQWSQEDEHMVDAYCRIIAYKKRHGC